MAWLRETFAVKRHPHKWTDIRDRPALVGEDGEVPIHGNPSHNPDFTPLTDFEAHTAAAAPHSGHEILSNKTTELGYSDDLYPTQGAVQRGLDGAVSTVASYELAFAYSDSSPVTFRAVNETHRILRAMIQIVTPFNGGSASVSIGHSGNANGLLAAGEVIAAQEGQYEAAPLFKYGGADTIKVYVTSGGSSQGSGTAYLLIEAA